MRNLASAAAGCCALLALLSGACVCAQEWKPQKNVDIVCSSGPGSSADRQARVVQKFLQSLPGMPSVSVTNRAGGGGMLALSYIVQRAGDPHFLGVQGVFVGAGEQCLLQRTEVGVEAVELVGELLQRGSHCLDDEKLKAFLKVGSKSSNYQNFLKKNIPLFISCWTEGR